MEKKKLSLGGKILIALILSIVVGLLFMKNPTFATEYIKPLGTIFLNLLKFIVVPVVLFSIMAGIISMKDVRKVGSVGITALVYYMVTTLFAVTIGLIGANIFKGTFPAIATTDLSYTQSASTNFMQTLVDIFPSNFINPLSNATMLQVIVMAILVGFAILLLGEKAEKTIEGVNRWNDVFVKAMDMILQLSPYGVFCLLTPVIATNGPQIIGSLAKVIGVAYLCYVVHALIVYSLTVSTLGGVSPWAFFKGMAPAMIFAFSSASSVGTLPINKGCAEKLGADKDVTSFVLPLGATINMDGTAIYQGVCAVFIACCYGIDLTLGQMITIIATATLASIGTAGVPGAGMVMLAMVLTSVGMPVDGIAIVAGVDRIFDMGRTTLNITGDSACAIIVTNLQKKREARKAAKAK